MFDNFEDAMAVLQVAVRSDNEHSGDYCSLYRRGIFDKFYYNRMIYEEIDDGI